MKRIVCVLLCLAMLMVCAGSLAVRYTLPEKMQKQLDIGSGLKGSFVLHGEGTHPLILGLKPFQDAEMQIRGLRSSGEMHYYIYQAGANEEQIGLTEMYDNGERIYLRSDFLPGEVLSIPMLSQLADILSVPEGGNPPLGSALLNLSSLSAEERSSLLDPAIERLSSRLELWVANYAAVSEVRTLENGTSVIDLNYSIPMSDFKQEIVSLFLSLLRSAEGTALMDRLLNDQQKEVFANTNLDYFYLDALNALNNDFDILYTRTISTLGASVSSTLELPLDDDRMQFQTLIIEEKGGLVSYTLRGEDMIYTLAWGINVDLTQVDAFSAWITVRPNPSSENINLDAYHAWRADISHGGSISTDEDSRDHERTEWSVRVVSDTSRLPEGEIEGNYPEEEPLSLDLKLHYFSKYSQSSPTTLEFDAALKTPEMSLSARGQLKTASPWIFTPFSTEGAKDLTQMSAAERTAKLAQFLAGAAGKLTPTPVEETSSENSGANTAPAESAAPAPAEESPDAEGTDQTESADRTSPDAEEEPDTEEAEENPGEAETEPMDPDESEEEEDAEP